MTLQGIKDTVDSLSHYDSTYNAELTTRALWEIALQLAIANEIAAAVSRKEKVELK